MLSQIATNVAAQARQKNLLVEQGATGTSIFDGFISGEDFNPKWESTDAIENVEQMRRTDSKIKASLMTVKLPVLGSTMRIEPVSDDPTDIKVAEFVENNLFKNPFFRWQDVLRQIMTYLEFGFCVMEKTYTRHEGKLWLWKFELRKQKTINRWMTEDGMLIAVEQSAVIGDDAKIITPVISADKIFHIAHDQEGLNFRGISLLRSAWRSFKIKDTLLRLDAIKHERYGVGIPEIETNSADDEQAKDVAEKLRSHELAYLIKTPKYKVGLFNGGKAQAGTDMMPSIRYHDEQMIANVLADFMQLGTGTPGGSLALGTTKADLFFKAEEALARHIENTFNETQGFISCIPQLVTENFANVTEFPKLKIEKLELQNLTEFAERLSKYKSQGMPFQDKDWEWIRDMENMPEMEEDASVTVKPVIEETPANISCQACEIKAQRGRKMAPELERFERRTVDLKGIKQKLDEVSKETQVQLAALRDDTVTKLIARALKIATKAKSVKEAQELLEATILPNSKAMENVIVIQGTELFKFGRETLKQELAKQDSKVQAIDPTEPVTEDVLEAQRSIRPQTKAALNIFFAKLSGEFSDAVMSMTRSGNISTEFVREKLNRVSEKIFNRDMGKVLNTAFGLGRGAEIARNKDKVRKIVRSEILDEATCNPCLAVDGQEFNSVDDPDFAPFRSGVFEGCEGGDNCRGINIVQVV